MVGGADYFNQQDRLYFPPTLQVQPFTPALAPGVAVVGGGNDLNINSNVNLVHSFEPESGALSATTSVATQFKDRDPRPSQVTGRGLLDVLDLPYQTSNVFTTRRAPPHQRCGRVRAGGTAALQRRAFAVTGDRSSNSADSKKYESDLKARAHSPFRAELGFVNQPKLRAACGLSATAGSSASASPRLSVANIEGQPNLAANGAIGADNLAPGACEIEGGFDTTLFHDRA